MQSRSIVAAIAAAVVVATPLSACSGTSKPPPTKASCPVSLPAPSMDVALDTIHVNVFNASGKGGLAADVSKQLGWRKISVISSGNDPLATDREPPKAAEIRYGAGGKQIALTLATQVENATLFEDNRTNPSVDLVLGAQFKMVPLPPPPAQQVQANVYNTTYRSGLGTQVAGDLTKRGFQIKNSGNDPVGRFFPGDAVVLMFGQQAEPAARRLALQFPDVRMIQDARTTLVVDVELGNKYAGVVPVAQATPAPSRATAKPAGCS